MKCDTISDLERFLEIQEQALGPTTPEVASTISKLAELHFQKGNLDKAETLFQRAFDIRASLRGFHREGIEATEERLVQIRQSRRQRVAAAVVANASEDQSGGQPVKTAEPAQQNMVNDAAPQSCTGEYNAVPTRSDEHSTVQSDTGEFAGVQLKTGEHAAVCGNRPAEPAAPAAKPNQTPGSGMRISGNTYKNMQNAIGEMEIELELMRQMMGNDHPAVADLLTRLADLYCRLRMYDKMEVLLVEALRIRETACGAEHASVALELKNLAALYCALERYAHAEPLLKRAITLRERAFGKIHPEVADVEEQYAQLLRKTNRAAQAEALEKHINEIRTSQDSPRFPRDSSFFGAA